MANHVTDQLTDRERDCLRLVAKGQSSKEIAAQLGISHHTVDLHLKRAIKALGVSSRRDAARLLEESQSQRSHIQLLDTQPGDLADKVVLLPISSPVRTETASRYRVAFLRNGRQFNDLTPIRRLGLIFVIALLLLLAVANLLNGLGALHTITG